MTGTDFILAALAFSAMAIGASMLFGCVDIVDGLYRVADVYRTRREQAAWRKWITENGRTQATPWHIRKIADELSWKSLLQKEAA